MQQFLEKNLSKHLIGMFCCAKWAKKQVVNSDISASMSKYEIWTWSDFSRIPQTEWKGSQAVWSL